MIENNDWRNWGAGEWFALFAKVLIGGMVIAFLAIHTLNLAEFIFPPEQVIYSYLLLGLTGGAVLAYLPILKYGSKTSLQKTIAIVMLVVSVIGELLAAGFGMQVESFRKEGISFTAEELIVIVRVIQVLGGFHALALIMSFVGADIMDAFASKKNSSVSSVSNSGFGKNPSPFLINQDKTDFTN